MGDTLDAAPRSAWSGRIVIAKLVDPTRRRSTKCQPSDGELATATDTVAPGVECSLEMRRSHPDRSPPGEEDRQIEQDNPNQQTRGQTEGKPPPPTSAGDCVRVGRWL
jgi:hypothetical protein